MLSAKEISSLKRSEWYYRWTPLLYAVVILTLLTCAASKVVLLRQLCSQTNITWARITELGFVREFDLAGIYSGVEVRAASLLEDAFMYLCAAGFWVGFLFVSRTIHRLNLALLHYADLASKNDTE